ncbi:EAL domain-containing protein [Qipengyuania sp. R86523]|uniref:sensor domain-containing phosphodiesterase n=1 Tax=Qipengyuania sp. R86523 TaxID=3093862 RepID=UPI0037C9CFCA
MSSELALAMSASDYRPRFEAVKSNSVERILQTVRSHLGAEIAFVGRYIEGGRRELMYVDSDIDLPVGAGFSEPIEESFCHHILEGRLPELIHDAADYPLAQTLPITKILPIGCHFNVPLRLANGDVFGSFCCVSRTVDRSVSQRDMKVLRAFANLAAEHIEESLGVEEQSARIEQQINGVLANRSISIVEQPIHELATMRIMGLECLSRFADAGQRGPDIWFGEAKSVGRGVELELMAIEQALKTPDRAGRDVYLSVNASPEAIISGKVAALLELHAGRKIVVELTEHERVENFGQLRDALREISRYARVAVDDVGAGYAGLRYLVDLSPDLLKLDISLTRNIHRDVARQAMAKAIVHFAAAIGSKVVAEGIESGEELLMLKEIGLDYGQGYHFAAPMLPEGASKYLDGLQPSGRSGTRLVSCCDNA